MRARRTTMGRFRPTGRALRLLVVTFLAVSATGAAAAPEADAVAAPATQASPHAAARAASAVEALGIAGTAWAVDQRNGTLRVHADST
ncbi:serine protease, partial [Streptomyces sp. NPDC000851]